MISSIFSSASAAVARWSDDDDDGILLFSKFLDSTAFDSLFESQKRRKTYK